MKFTKINFVFVLFVLSVFTLSNCGEMGINNTVRNNLISNFSINDVDRKYIMPYTGALNEIPQHPDNILTDEKVLLGRKLIDSKGIGMNPKGDGLATYSCTSCHRFEKSGHSDLVQAVGEGSILKNGKIIINPDYDTSFIDVQFVTTRSTYNGAFKKKSLWNGQFGYVVDNMTGEDKWKVGTPLDVNNYGVWGLEVQAIAGQGVHGLKTDRDIIKKLGLEPYYIAAYPNVKNPNLLCNELSTGLAIAAYERTLITYDAPFQKKLRGDYVPEWNERMARGMDLFFNKANCSSCHNNPSFGSDDFYRLGFADMKPEDGILIDTTNVQKGRGGYTGIEDDNFRFMTPQLYNLFDAPAFGHGGTFKTLKEVVKYKNKAVSQNKNVPTESLHIKPLGLTENEIDDLVYFIEVGLYDKNINQRILNSYNND